MGYTTYFKGGFDITLPNLNLPTGATISDEFDKNIIVRENKGRTIIDDLNPIQTLAFVNLLANTRRMERDLSKSISDDPLSGNKPSKYFGEKGEFYVPLNSLGNCGQTEDETVINYNRPPETQPGLWLQWVVNYSEYENKFVLEWDQNEKFYKYTEWLKYLIEKVFEPKGIKLNGSVEWEGEESDDVGMIIVKNNKIEIKN